ncbi:MAG: hypothetical protein U5K54_13885 [Cytophagales bacterium]|nr:hypothetical protein [Cytophagales bacterium]
MIAMFTALTIASLISLQYTPFAFSLSDLIGGFRLHLSREEIAIAIGAFGITGVASDEILAYNYWCLKKGTPVTRVHRMDHQPGSNVPKVG